MGLNPIKLKYLFRLNLYKYFFTTQNQNYLTGNEEYLHNYFIVDVDRERRVYRAIKVDLRANALSNDIVELDIKN